MGWAARMRKKFQHNDAFMRMLYRCEKCGAEEHIWNSRDGITPFCVNCVACGETANHVDWDKDIRLLPDEYVPPPGSRIFVNLTIEKAREYRRTYVEKWWDAPIEGMGTMAESGMYESKDAAIEQLAAADLAEFAPYTPSIEVVPGAAKELGL